MISMHTSPLEQPGSGDAGGLNVYVVQLARRLAALGTEVEVFTRATAADLDPVVEAAPGVLVRHVSAGPFGGVRPIELTAQLCSFTAGVLRAEAAQPPGHYALVHSHYWLSGLVGSVVADRLAVPLVHTMHTMGLVKNADLAAGDVPEPETRIDGERQVVALADTLVANTSREAADLIRRYGADPARVAEVAPGVDLDTFTPGTAGARARARAWAGLAPDDVVLLFAGRVQPLKAPDVLLRAAAVLARDPAIGPRIRVVIVGGTSGSGSPDWLPRLAADLGIADRVRFEPAVPQADLVRWFRAADVVACPSYNESFGLVAAEAQASGVPVVARDVGGLSIVVADRVSGRLVTGDDPRTWADALADVVADPTRRAALARGARSHAERFGWDAAASAMIEVYRRTLRAAPTRVPVG
jgi:D-inositol-3-phosphate glycosyltransferase